jgi:hypothetical protein
MILQLAALSALSALSEDFEALKREIHMLPRAEVPARLAALHAQAQAEGPRPHQDKIDHF